MGDALIRGLLRCGIKANKIAQSCREKRELFEILVQEKGRLKSNDLDFKTLADVFIQQVVINELETLFEGIASRIYGEENNEFTNLLGETITVEVKENVYETTQMLLTVLDNNETAARLMAEEAHNTVCNELDYITLEDLNKIAQFGINIDDIGIWIDPIDGTSQYVKGYEQQTKDAYNVCPKGLECVTVLMGVYHIKTGSPIMGMIFQPFCNKIDNGWNNRCIWGVSYGDMQLNNISTTNQGNKRDMSPDCAKPCIVASIHDSSAQTIIRQTPCNISFAGGAGYKCLCVIDGLVDSFFYSEDTCYKWDTCAPHAILLSLGGGIAVLNDAAMQYKEGQGKGNSELDQILSKCQIKYNQRNPEPLPPWCNSGGSVAYSASPNSKTSLQHILPAIAQRHCLG